jgi:hypothetical protein
MGCYFKNGKWTPRFTVATIKKRLSSAYLIIDAFTKELQRGIMDSGCARSVDCKGKADVVITEEMMARPTLEWSDGIFPRMPGSSDSDLLIYASLPGMFRRLPDGTYLLLTKERVLATLGVQHHRHLVLYGTVSRNYYVSNIRTVGLITNRNIIWELVVDWSGYGRSFGRIPAGG